MASNTKTEWLSKKRHSFQAMPFPHSAKINKEMGTIKI